ncbi:unnamed protein product [Eruca vesicaria subsp. sativa]|uniref:Uncharacterized protein n=1 Tax=Eruca vesicaria subsp. sativa TaxID=29727 RepID=A0ABC8LID5_ERUVS|nr:unnamed protein product [Eruca vesicaria subsp. sativa]
MSTLDNPSRFDIENVSIPSHIGGITGLMPYNCVGRWNYSYPDLVELYAKLGLHRYNMFKETNYQLDFLVKFNMLQKFLPVFYMTLLAHDPALDPLKKTFQVEVDEHEVNSLNITCSISRVKDEVSPRRPYVPRFFHLDAAEKEEDGLFKGDLPDWPSDDALNDAKRFYLVKKSEWQSNDWISMYVDVFSKLEILDVAIETGIEDVEPPNERLKATSANVYIKFKGLANVCSPGFESGEHVVCKAVVRRVLDVDGNLTIQGKFCGAPTNLKKPLQNGKRKNQSFK